jgi:hypothetical protein
MSLYCQNRDKNKLFNKSCLAPVILNLQVTVFLFLYYTPKNLQEDLSQTALPQASHFSRDVSTVHEAHATFLKNSVPYWTSVGIYKLKYRFQPWLWFNLEHFLYI